MGRLQPRVAWDQIYIARSKGWPPLSVSIGNTHAPRPGGLPTSYNWYLPPWPLCTVCARKRLTTYWTAPYLWQGQVVAQNKCGGYWNKTRSMADSGGLWVPCMTCITNIFQPTESPPIIPYYAIPDITVPTETGDKLTPTQGRGFPGFLSGMHARHMRIITITSNSFPTARKSLICIHANDHITWNNKFSE